MSDGLTSSKQYICQRVDLTVKTQQIVYGPQEIGFTPKIFKKNTHSLKGNMFLGQARGSSVLIFTQASQSTRYFLSLSLV